MTYFLYTLFAYIIIENMSHGPLPAWLILLAILIAFVATILTRRIWRLCCGADTKRDQARVLILSALSMLLATSIVASFAFGGSNKVFLCCAAWTFVWVAPVLLRVVRVSPKPAHDTQAERQRPRTMDDL